MTLDLFVNPWAGHYRNRWYWDRLLNKLEEAPWFPERISRRLRGATREEDFLYERAYRLADKYRRIMRNKGLSHVTITVADFQRILAKSIRERPISPKIVCSGDGGIKEAFTAGINYVERHNRLEEKVAATFNRKVLSLDGEISSGLDELLSKIRKMEINPLQTNPTQTNPTQTNTFHTNTFQTGLSLLGRLILNEGRVDFNFLRDDLELDEKEKEFVEEYRLSLKELLLAGQLPYPSFGIIRGGTFNVVAHQLKLAKDVKYLEEIIQQREGKEARYEKYCPLRVEYGREEGKERTLFGSIYGHGAIRAFFELYYGGKLHPGGLKAAYIALLFRHFHRERFSELTAAKPYSYGVELKDGSSYSFDQETTLSVVSGIRSLPFQMEFFQPEEGMMHAVMTRKAPEELVKKALLSIAYIGKPLGLFGIRNQYEIEREHRDVSELVIRAGKGEKVKFMFDGDIKDDKGTPYNSQEVRLSRGPELKIINPFGKIKRKIK